MSASVKTKMCWSCDGSVPFESETCPFCGVTLQQTTPQHQFQSPYRLAKREENESIPVAPLLKVEETPDEEDSLVDQTKKVMITLGCLSAGVVLILFGLILVIFSGNDEVLVLKWDAHYWYLYLAVGIPLLIIGWRTFGSIVDQEE